jgi:hypothetical protein
MSKHGASGALDGRLPVVEGRAFPLSCDVARLCLSARPLAIA